MKMNNIEKEKQQQKLEESGDFETESKIDSKAEFGKLEKKFSKLESKFNNAEENIKNTINYSIKSIGYISIIISLGLTAIVGFMGLASNRVNFEWWHFLIGIFIIFVSMLGFFMISIWWIFKQTDKYMKKNNKNH